MTKGRHCKFVTSLRVRGRGHASTDRTNNERMSQHIVNARTEGAKESGKSWGKLNDDVEEDLQTMRVS
jgi:hypothetical protein